MIVWGGRAYVCMGEAREGRGKGREKGNRRKKVKRKVVKVNTFVSTLLQNTPTKKCIEVVTGRKEILNAIADA